MLLKSFENLTHSKALGKYTKTTFAVQFKDIYKDLYFKTLFLFSYKLRIVFKVKFHIFVF
jgi:hypothetical protein